MSIRGDKWRSEEDVKFMEFLREKGVNWKDILEELFGKSEILSVFI